MDLDLYYTKQNFHHEKNDLPVWDNAFISYCT